MFKAVNVLYTVEEDIFEYGCDPETSRSVTMNETYTGETLDELFENIADDFGVDKNTITVNECEKNVVTLSRYETASGNKPTENAINHWKMGKRKLFLADYMFVVSETNDVDFSKMTTDEIKSFGISIQ